MTADLGKDTFVNWLFEINLIYREIDFTMEHLHEWMADECVDTPMSIGPAKSYIVKEPLGVVVIFGAWNFPMTTPLSPVISAMAAGNTVVLKPSELSPHTSSVMQILFDKILDPDCYVCVNGGIQVAIRASQLKADFISFTGSTDKGRLIAKAAAENLVPVMLELGGQCPMIVD